MIVQRMMSIFCPGNQQLLSLQLWRYSLYSDYGTVSFNTTGKEFINGGTLFEQTCHFTLKNGLAIFHVILNRAVSKQIAGNLRYSDASLTAIHFSTHSAKFISSKVSNMLASPSALGRVTRGLKVQIKIIISNRLEKETTFPVQNDYFYLLHTPCFDSICRYSSSQ